MLCGLVIEDTGCVVLVLLGLNCDAECLGHGKTLAPRNNRCICRSRSSLLGRLGPGKYRAQPRPPAWVFGLSDLGIREVGEIQVVGADQSTVAGDR